MAAERFRVGVRAASAVSLIGGMLAVFGGTAHAASTFSIGPVSMEGDMQVQPGDALSAGYDFTIPGNHPTVDFAFDSATVTLPYFCNHSDTGTEYSFTINLYTPPGGYTDPANSSQWVPDKSNQNSPLLYQGSIIASSAADQCGPTATMYMNYHGSFGATFSGIGHDYNGASFSALNVRFHYHDPQHGPGPHAPAGVTCTDPDGADDTGAFGDAMGNAASVPPTNNDGDGDATTLSPNFCGASMSSTGGYPISSASVSGNTALGAPTNAPAQEAGTVVLGETVNPEACGFAPGQPLTERLNGSTIGSSTADSNGCAQTTLSTTTCSPPTVTVLGQPVTAVAGANTLTLTGTAANGQPLTQTVQFQVPCALPPAPISHGISTPFGRLPFTGSEVELTLAAAAALIGVGLVLRRRGRPGALTSSGDPGDDSAGESSRDEEFVGPRS